MMKGIVFLILVSVLNSSMGQDYHTEVSRVYSRLAETERLSLVVSMNVLSSDGAQKMNSVFAHSGNNLYYDIDGSKQILCEDFSLFIESEAGKMTLSLDKKKPLKKGSTVAQLKTLASQDDSIVFVRRNGPVKVYDQHLSTSDIAKVRLEIDTVSYTMPKITYFYTKDEGHGLSEVECTLEFKFGDEVDERLFQLETYVVAIDKKTLLPSKQFSSYSLEITQ